MNPLILDDYYMKAVGRLTGELGTDVELVSTAFTKNQMLSPQVISTRVLPDSTRRTKHSLLYHLNARQDSL